MPVFLYVSATSAWHVAQVWESTYPVSAVVVTLRVACLCQKSQPALAATKTIAQIEAAHVRDGRQRSDFQIDRLMSEEGARKRSIPC